MKIQSSLVVLAVLFLGPTLQALEIIPFRPEHWLEKTVAYSGLKDKVHVPFVLKEWTNTEAQKHQLLKGDVAILELYNKGNPIGRDCLNPLKFNIKISNSTIPCEINPLIDRYVPPIYSKLVSREGIMYQRVLDIISFKIGQGFIGAPIFTNSLTAVPSSPSIEPASFIAIPDECKKMILRTNRKLAQSIRYWEGEEVSTKGNSGRVFWNKLGKTYRGNFLTILQKIIQNNTSLERAQEAICIRNYLQGNPDCRKRPYQDVSITTQN